MRIAGRSSRFFLLLILTVFTVGAAAEELPTAEEVLDKFVEATGGTDAYHKLQNRHLEGSTEFVTQGITIPFTIYQARPLKMYVLSESDVVGKVERGTDGEVAWENTLMGGPQVKEGSERAIILYSATFDAIPDWRRYLAQVELQGVEEIDGKPCYKVRVEANNGIVETRFFDRETGLLVKMEATLELPQGKFPMESYPSDYREVDGVLLAHKSVVKIAGQERVTTMGKIEHNVELPEGVFDLPPEIRELVDKG